MRPPPTIHYLRRNDGEHTPPVVAFLDTETSARLTPAGEVLTLRLWHLRVVVRRATRNAQPGETDFRGLTGAQLADRVDEVTRRHRNLWLFAHNLGFDMTTTRLPQLLCAAGWKVTAAAIGSRTPWMRLSLGSRALALTDSYGWLPAALAQVGPAVGRIKPPLPDEGDSHAAWAARCEADVDVLARAVCDLMDWWDREGLGYWSITGSASGWNAFRHIHTRNRVVIDPDPERVAFDRLAVYGGRRAVTRVGTLKAGPYVDLDFQAAYPTIARWLPLPQRRGRTFTSLPIDAPELDNPSMGVLAECVISAEKPRYPCRVGANVWYPVGTYRTVLAGPDITEAKRRGELVEVGPGQVHWLQPVMSPWARWVLAVAEGRDENAPPVARIAAKAWSRSVIGRWAQRSWTSTAWGPSPGEGWGFEPGWDAAGNCPGAVVDLGGQRSWQAASASGDNAYPAILAWIESHVRVRLARAIDAIGPGAVLQCNTDGLVARRRGVGTKGAGARLVRPAGMRDEAALSWLLGEIEADVWPLRLRVKGRYDHLQILGPSHLQLDDRRRWSGIPRSAEVGADGAATGRLWPGWAWQMNRGTPGGYVRPEVKMTLSGVRPPGWLRMDGTVVPPGARIAPNGATELVPWFDLDASVRRIPPAVAQHEQLARLMDADLAARSARTA